jgi:release factor glutamine methyltransferase
MTIETALRQGTTLLEEAGIAAPRLTAEVLLMHALGCERSHLYGHPEHPLKDLEQLHYGRYLHERLANKPTQYITGRQEFYGREFRVNQDVLIPRPETEHIVEAALELAGGARRIVDVGTGSGALAVTLQLETGARVVGTDISLAALKVAKENATRLGATVQWVACDVGSAMADGTADLVVSNPPYVPSGDTAGLQREVREYEPHIALFAGPTGLELYARVIADAARILRAGGWLIVELGFQSRDGVLGMLDREWEETTIRPDLAGIPRVLAARRAVTSADRPHPRYNP